VEQVGAYASTTGCRRAFILASFGQAYDPPCHRCDHCRAGWVPVIPDPAAAAVLERFPLSAAVNDVTWGPGVVERHEAGAITVRFGSAGHRRLALELIGDGDLLRPAPSRPAGVPTPS
jgi:ATP-dependent DNA helicase RecQ